MKKLHDYQQKRDFSKTTEPVGNSNKKGIDVPIFVIQKHKATNLHFDIRLEIDGVLKSWAIPKGPSTNPKIKRMAIPTEDHPIEYANFEGTIPKDEYGGGTVMIWDKGTFENIKTDDDGNLYDLKKAYENGTIEVKLKGKKISGEYALIKMKSGEVKGNWLLIKMKDEESDARRNPVNTENKSVLTGRSMHEIEQEND